MTTATIFTPSDAIRRDVYFQKDIIGFVERNFEHYDIVAKVDVDLRGEQCCEDLFDLTNNPYRDEERAERYGRHASISVGDVILTNDGCYVCDIFGWKVFG